jgi:LysM repeat protein
MYFKTTLITVLSFLAVPCFAFSYRDSIGVENLSGKKVVIYKIDPKDNYYSVGRKYGVSPKIIIDFNKNIALKVGTIIRIPTQTDYQALATIPAVAADANAATESQHTVVKKETLYSISALYGMKIEELKKLNNLKSNALSIGQIVKVIKNQPATSIAPVATADSKDIPTVPKPEPQDKTQDTVVTNPAKEIPTNKYGITEMQEKGAAVWIDDKNLDATKSYALHRTAPVGTVIKITNPMSGRSVFAKVVGRYTENETTKDVIIVITRAAAEAIGVIDKRFFVNIGYGIPTNEK